MYLYVSFDAATKLISPIALMPPSRGKPAKHHAEISAGPVSFYSAVIPSEAVSSIPKNPMQLKAGISSGEVPLVADAYMQVSVDALLYALGNSLVDMLTQLPREFIQTLPPSEQRTLIAARDGLDEAVANVDKVEIGEIIARNRKMLNVLLNSKPDGVGWWHDPATLDRTTEPAPAAKLPEETLDEKAEKAEQMTATTVSFGFGKMTSASPELKIAAEPERDTAAANGVFLPTPDETYIINEQVAQLFKILQISRRNCPQNVRLLGPHGCGKTELAIQFAARLKMPLLIMDCANLREARDWFGYKGAKDGTVYWHESQFVRAVTAGNHVILLDELNRANPHLLNTLMPLLDARRFTYLEEKGDKICVGPGTVFFASMNEGAGYTGTSSLDRAIRDRFPRVIEMSYLGEKDEIKLLMRRVGIDEDIATRLVGMANKIRQDSTGLSATLTESMSTRQLIAAAHDFAIGGVDTLTFTISNHFSPDGDDDSERVRVQNIIQGKFGDMLAAKAAAATKGA
jgi:MoxR-like ATPase